MNKSFESPNQTTKFFYHCTLYLIYLSTLDKSMNTMVSPSCKEGEKVFDTFLAISSAEYFIHIILVVAAPSSST